MTDNDIFLGNIEAEEAILGGILLDPKANSNKRPSMADIKDSGDIEQDMDLGLLLYRDEYYKSDTDDKGIIEIIVGKNRNGGTGTCKVMFNPSVGKFTNLEEY